MAFMADGVTLDVGAESSDPLSSERRPVIPERIGAGRSRRMTKQARKDGEVNSPLQRLGAKADPSPPFAPLTEGRGRCCHDPSAPQAAHIHRAEEKSGALRGMTVEVVGREGFIARRRRGAMGRRFSLRSE